VLLRQGRDAKVTREVAARTWGQGRRHGAACWGGGFDVDVRRSGRRDRGIRVGEYNSGWRMIFTIERDGDVVLGLYNPRLDIKRGSKASVLMQIDESPVITRQFVAINPTLIGTTFTSQVDWFQRLRRGLGLKIKFGERVQTFSLKGTNDALVVLFACVAKFRNL
jgi:hypothetical protein